jgi:hypothetical protein
LRVVANNINSNDVTMTNSPLGLLEELFTDQPWRLLICTIFLNRTHRRQVDATLYRFFQRWPTPESLICCRRDDDLDDDAPSVITNDGGGGDGGGGRDDGTVIVAEDEGPNGTTRRRKQDLERCIAEIVAPMGMTNRRARGILRFCGDYLSLLASKQTFNSQEAAGTGPLPTMQGVEFSLTRKEICSLFYCAEYAADAYQLFIRRDFASPLLSNDHALMAYSDWKRSGLSL